MKITDVKCTVMGQNPVVRIKTDAGIDGLGQAENAKPYLKPHVLFYKQHLLGCDPTTVERTMMKIRRLGGFKPSMPQPLRSGQFGPAAPPRWRWQPLRREDNVPPAAAPAPRTGNVFAELLR